MNSGSFEYIRRLLLRRAGIALDANKEYLVQARLAPLAKRRGLHSIDQLVGELQLPHNASLMDDVVDAMTTNETYFFRDTVPFEALRRVVFPELFRRRAPMRRVTIWSAACSTGQEPYSVAMLLREHFPDYLHWNICLLGTDLSRAALGQAREGRYKDLEMARGLSASLQSKYFRRVGKNWLISDEIRSMVEFRPLNLAAQWPDLIKMDVILLRNVMVYFETVTKRWILDRVRRQMWPDGYLFLGGAETTLHLDNAFARVTLGDVSFFQLRDGLADSDASPLVT